MDNKKKAIFLQKDVSFRQIYSPATIERLQNMVDVKAEVTSREEILSNPDAYADVEIAFSGWHAPVLDRELLDCLPRLSAFLYGAGSVKSLLTEACWERDLLVTSSLAANAIPVVEYTVSMIILSLKDIFRLSREMHRTHAWTQDFGVPGVYLGSKVGVVALGQIGRLLCQRLSTLDLEVYAYDPTCSDAVFAEFNVTRVDSLSELFESCDVVSLHAPLLPETRGMITGELVQRMPKKATLINTARGQLIDEASVLAMLRERKDLFAILDVFYDEPPENEELYSLPNVFLSPHMAGSMGRECHRMGAYVVDECRRYLAGEPALWPVRRESVATRA